MKLSRRIFVAVGVVCLSVGAVASSTWVNTSIEIFGNGGDLGGYIRAEKECKISPEGTNGYTRITGSIAGVIVNEYLSYSDSCPEIDNALHTIKNAFNTVSLNGVVITSYCIDQTFGHGSQTYLIKHPDRQPVSRIIHFSQHWTQQSNTNNGSCIVIATNAIGGTETYGSYTHVRGYKDRTHKNR